jgi:hypothetical protein
VLNGPQFSYRRITDWQIPNFSEQILGVKLFKNFTYFYRTKFHQIHHKSLPPSHILNQFSLVYIPITIASCPSGLYLGLQANYFYNNFYVRLKFLKKLWIFSCICMSCRIAHLAVTAVIFLPPFERNFKTIFFQICLGHELTYEAAILNKGHYEFPLSVQVTV